ncbi:MAG TPA: acetylxylan esterase [Cyclobacteriaceae bacterium]|nr:acetylxylan esterase [Cyclobacteriaceae bacterium]
MKTVLLFVLLALVYNESEAQLSQAARDSIARLSSADHEQMKKQLGITAANRPGPSGNPEAPNAANRDESKVRKYTLPDPLVMKNGKKVTTAKEWTEKRRAEIVEDFDREMYGRLPKNIPGVTWKVVFVKDTTFGQYKAKEKRLLGVVDNSAYPNIKVEIELVLGTPAGADKGVPVVMEFGFIRSPFGNPAAEPANRLAMPGEPGWKEQLISRGWGYAVIVPSSIQADNGAGLRSGIIGLVNKGEPRKPDDWGSLRAWGWGASSALDYFETDPDVDARRVAIEGLSRYGKAAAVAMAYDSRFSLGFIGSAGAGGSKILRRNFGEQVENLAASGEYHWFCGNFIKYASTQPIDDLPVDAHELIALCAPRPVFISSGSPQVEGQWVDAKGMFLAGLHAGPVYTLLGKKDLGATEFPPLGLPLVSGDIAFRQHAGGHSTGPNWSTWIAWACRYWGDCKYY